MNNAPNDRLQEALSLHKSGNLERASGLYEALLVEYPGDVDACLLFAMLRDQQGRFDAAVALYQRVLELDPMRPQAAAALASVHFRRGELPEAETYWRRAVALDPRDQEALNGLCELLLKRHAFLDAVPLLRQFAEQNPGNGKVRIKLGEVLRDLGRYDESETVLREAVAMAPNDPEAHCELATLHWRTEAFGEARRGFERAIALQPGHRSILRLLGMLEQLGKHDEIQAWKEAIMKANPGVKDLGLGSAAYGDTDPMAKHRDFYVAQAASDKARWHRADELAFWPLAKQPYNDFRHAIENFVLKESVIPREIFDDGARVLTMGSCFAAHLRRILGLRGKQAETIGVPEGLNNTFALRNFVEWCLTGNRSSDGYWYDNDEHKGAHRWEPAVEQRHYERAFRSTAGFVITVGMAEVWRDKVTGDVFWRGVPEAIFDKSRHVCELTTVDENVANLRTIYQLIQDKCGPRPVIVTISPVPLNATSRPMSCVLADCVSKSTLRVAVEYLLMEKHPQLHYWPSFEIVRWLGAHMDRATFGGEGQWDDARHVPEWVVTEIVDAFIAKAFRPPAA